MSSDSETSTERYRRLAIEHVRRWSLAYGRAGTVVAAVVFLGVALGFRGLGPAATELANAAGSLPEASPGALKTAHPFLEAFAGYLGAGLGLPALSTLRWIGLLAVASGVLAVAGIGAKCAGLRGAVAAGAVFVCLPQVAGAGTTVGPTALFLGMWTWFLRLLVVDRHRWYGTLLLWILGAALLLTWPPFAFWGAIWLALEVRDADYASRSPEALDGEFGGTDIPLAILLSPLAVVVVAMVLHPAVWSDPFGAAKALGEFALSWTGPTFTFAGESYAESRPPPWTGTMLLWWTIPAFVLASSAAGWSSLLVSNWRENRSARLTQRMCLWGLPLATLLPWLNRGPAWGDLHFTAVLAPFLAVTAGIALVRGLDGATALLESELGETARRAALPVGAGLLGLLLLGTAFRAHPVQGSYYSSLAGGFSAAVESGLPVSRDGVYPVDVLRRARDRTDADSLAVLEQGNLVRQYRRLGLLTGVEPAKRSGAADARIRRLDRFDPGTEPVLENPNALVDLTEGAAPLLHIDGLPVYWLEWTSR